MASLEIERLPRKTKDLPRKTWKYGSVADGRAIVWGRCFFYSKDGLIWASGFLCEKDVKRGWNPSLCPPWASTPHPWMARGNAGRAMQGREELSERVSDPNLAFTFASFRSQTPVARAQIHTQCLVSRWQSRAVRAGASALCVCYLICICLGCRAET